MENLEEKITNENVEEVAVIEEAPVVEADNAPAAGIIGKYLNTRNIIIAAAALAAVVVISIIIAIFSANSAESVAKRFIKAETENDIKTWTKLLAYDFEEMMIDWYGDEEEFFEDMSWEYDEDIESWNDYYKVAKENYQEDLEDDYGKYKIEVEAKKSKDISISKFEDEVDYEWCEDYGFDIDDVKKAKVVSVTVRLNGEYENDKAKVEIYMVKIGGSWKVIEWYYE